jgi:hypothetical protein
MASHTIKFTVTGSSIDIDKTPERVSSNDTVIFQSLNSPVTVNFDGAQWPFTGSPGSILVPAAGNQTPGYTVHDPGPGATEHDRYTVKQNDGPASNNGHIDIVEDID